MNLRKNFSIVFFFVLALSISILLVKQSSTIHSEAQMMPSPPPGINAVTPTLFCLGGVPCGSTGASSVLPVGSIQTTSAQSPCVAGTDNNSLFAQHLRHHHHDDGAISGGGDELLSIILQLLLLFLQLLGAGGNVSSPCTPGTAPIQMPSLAPGIGQALVPSIAVNPTTAPVAVAVPTTPATVTQPVAAPAGPVVNPPTSPTDNWAGYVFKTPLSQNAKTSSEWTISKVDCSGGDGTASPWVGEGGNLDNDKNLSQLGTDLLCQGGADTYKAWTERYPDALVYLSNPVSLGDHMTASVTFQGAGKFATTISNTTKGWKVDMPMAYQANYIPQSGEVIVESAVDTPLVPKFADINFTNSLFFPDGSQQVPFASAPQLEKEDIVSKSNIQQTNTGPISGGNFTLKWAHN